MPNSREHADESSADATVVMTNWQLAISQFYDWHNQLIQAITVKKTAAYPLLSNAFNQLGHPSLNELIELELESIRVLNGLTQELDWQDEKVHPFIKLQRLKRQTLTLQDWNKRAQNALTFDVADNS